MAQEQSQFKVLNDTVAHDSSIYLDLLNITSWIESLDKAPYTLYQRRIGQSDLIFSEDKSLAYTQRPSMVPDSNSNIHIYKLIGDKLIEYD